MVPGDPGTLFHLLMPPSHGWGLGAEKMQPPQIPASVQKPRGRWPVGLSWTTCLSIFLENLEGTLVFGPLGQCCPLPSAGPCIQGRQVSGAMCSLLPMESCCYRVGPCLRGIPPGANVSCICVLACAQCGRHFASWRCQLLTFLEYLQGL